MALLTIFAAGVLHGLGPDHLAAISGFGAATGAGATRLALFAIRFALGHVGTGVRSQRGRAAYSDRRGPPCRRADWTNRRSFAPSRTRGWQSRAFPPSPWRT